MDQQVLEQLDRIERAAEKILSDANGRKSELLKANEEKQAAFDRDIDAKADAKIEELRARIQQQHREEEEKLTSGTRKVKDRLNQEYRNKKAKIAEGIVKSILK